MKEPKNGEAMLAYLGLAVFVLAILFTGIVIGKYML